VIIGSGMLAKAFAPKYASSENIWIYAAGVSNSSCTNLQEFNRERSRLMSALEQSAHADVFVYFSTCSILDPEAKKSDYVQHKIEMEKLVSDHPNYFIARLSQVAGVTPNPHTLLNYLYARVSRSESFVIWENAIRNIIDVEDVVLIITEILCGSQRQQKIVNIANSQSYSIINIVSGIEIVTGKTAVVETINAGGAYNIDTVDINDIVSELGLKFDDSYLLRVLSKYYG
jgi:nucleoside-diphosphate-sugar epimerase